MAITTTTSLMMVKRQALIDIGLYDENLQFWQEYDLTIRLAQRKPFYFVNEPLCVYRIDRKDKGRLTNKYFAWREAVRYIHEKHAALYAKLNPLERLQVWLLTVNDAQNRCLSAGLIWRHRYYKLVYKLMNFPFHVVWFIRRRVLCLEQCVAKMICDSRVTLCRYKSTKSCTIVLTLSFREITVLTISI